MSLKDLPRSVRMLLVLLSLHLSLATSPASVICVVSFQTYDIIAAEYIKVIRRSQTAEGIGKCGGQRSVYNRAVRALTPSGVQRQNP